MQIKKINLERIREEENIEGEDYIAVEEPMHLKVCKDSCETFAVVMRTPGNDKELSLGFLYSEGVINGIEDVKKVVERGSNTVEVWVNRLSGVKARDIIVNSSCGVCGRALLYTISILKSNLKVHRKVIFSLPEILRENQNAFNVTGGLHAAALFNSSGKLLKIYEDVGRHNAVDKIVGSLLLEKGVPADECILLVSGRLGYEIVSKGIKAGIPIIAGISAPTSLAVQMAEEARVTLIGFLRGDSFNIYSHTERII
ncbi:formate dehydrogenase accessory sulfurtransferase FdhD [Acidianus sp. HS-5]|uniref:formate dehydrogenase accessory sulfurtransferase FdhD n=1 Tax=Acidianus sp. HS-5 TaxID=2886040 RepID=UPI001F032756|nr:formate dehydrogenase accessory sulfurtransferase FdhD [Acidianus sp. HS-5]BDC17540.1 sulfurtransferase FdhD [Acidianus sp. HS-5]